jgi:hypothetical protein
MRRERGSMVKIHCPKNCNDCIFHDSYVGMITCRYQPVYKNRATPVITNGKPDFCNIKQIVVYEEDDPINS